MVVGRCILSVLLGAALACRDDRSRSRSTMSEPMPSVLEGDHAPPTPDGADAGFVSRMRLASARVDVVFVGTVASVGRSPGTWGGAIVVPYQRVTYRVVERLKQKYATLPDEVVIEHPIVFDALHTVQKTPELRGDIFHVEAQLIVFARCDDAVGDSCRRWTSLPDIVVPADPEALAELRNDADWSPQ